MGEGRKRGRTLREAAALTELYRAGTEDDADDEERATVTLSGKHQVTLPAAMVRELGMRPGDKLSVRRRGQELVLTRLPRTPEEWVARYRGALRGVYGETPEAIEDYIRKERESWEERERRLGS
ncbi:MAG TPA: AbrB/MazE/SpoVT family DNA-binding domain-containing protein [Dehalococcoidia bacterium]|nr:AbrB/MazE/SpoVT family DNA-binding domain-containing protein [Dehalococcoidia bacterium]